MKKALLLSLAIILVVLVVPAVADAAVACKPVTITDPDWGFSWTLTAALVDPTGPVTGEVDATGCGIGVYYSQSTRKGLIQNAKIHGATDYGVLVYAGPGAEITVDVLSSSIYDIGDGGSPVTEAMWLRGVGIYYMAGYGAAKGRIAGNFVSRYMTSGIYAGGPFVSVQIADNIISGTLTSENRPQMGIYAASGPSVTIERNTITGNVSTSTGWYWFANGIGLYGVVGALISDNVLVNNQVGINVDNETPNPGGPTTPTRVTIINNRVVCDRVYIVPPLFQAGIAVWGYRDKIASNQVSGKGYERNVDLGTYEYLLGGETIKK